LREDFGIEAFAQQGKTGVWVRPQNSTLKEPLKIASLGVAVQRWVSFHGASINLKMEPGIWSLIQPCGFGSEIMTDLWSQVGVELSPEQAAKQLINKFKLLVTSK
jgi:lipoate-protein ligase B